MERQTNRRLNTHLEPIRGEGQIPTLQQADTCWKTNLMLSQQIERVKERSLNFHKRTSFEQNLINLHIKEMFKAIVTTSLSVAKQTLPTNDKEFNLTISTKQIPQIRDNSYFTEEEKLQIIQVMLQNQQNFSILMRLGSVFDQNKQELFYILSKLLYYCTAELKVKEKYNSEKQNVLQMMENHKIKVLDWMLNQEIVKLINPVFFSNVNQKPIMLIIDNWFYHILCIKQGLYGESIMEDFGGEETHFEEEEENLFQI